MTTKYFNVGNDAWGVLLCMDYDLHDADDMWAIMRSFGMSNRKANEAIRILMSLNTGMTVSNDDIRMSAVFVSDASSEDEWWSTLAHELKHACDAIIDYYGKELDGESSAYTYGELMRMVVNEIAEPCYYLYNE